MVRYLILVLGLVSSGARAAEKAGFHCEIKEGDTYVDDDNIKTKKACKEKKGQWVKAHDHDHAHGHDHGHEHSHDAE